MTRIPDDDLNFFYCAVRQLPPPQRATFVARVLAGIRACPDLGPGDFDRIVRQALAGLWTPSPPHTPSRWTRAG